MHRDALMRRSTGAPPVRQRTKTHSVWPLGALPRRRAPQLALSLALFGVLFLVAGTVNVAFMGCCPEPPKPIHPKP
jgi:hypothetical protein